MTINLTRCVATQWLKDGRKIFTLTGSGLTREEAVNNLGGLWANARFDTLPPGINRRYVEYSEEEVPWGQDHSVDWGLPGPNAPGYLILSLKADPAKLFRINLPYVSTSLRASDKTITLDGSDGFSSSDPLILLTDGNGNTLADAYNLVSAKFRK